MDKISLTLYDLMGYLLPGAVILFACSILESTFLGSDLLGLPHITDNLIVAAVAAYFLGHLGHRLSSILGQLYHSPGVRRIKARVPRKVKAKMGMLLGGEMYRLSDPLFRLVRKTVQQAYRIELAEEEKLNTLEIYILADSYVTASGGSVERDIWIVVEGFYKTSMASFGILSLVLLSSVFAGGAIIRAHPEVLLALGWQLTATLAAVTILVTLLIRTGCVFYGQLKRNNTYALFLALRRKEERKEEE